MTTHSIARTRAYTLAAYANRTMITSVRIARRALPHSAIFAHRPFSCLSTSLLYIEGALPAPFSTPESFGLSVVADFLSVDEENALVSSAEAALNRRGWEEDHWDGVIKGYRESQVSKSRLAPLAAQSISRAASTFPVGPRTGPLLNTIHFLELKAEGEIFAHVDSVKFSGGVVSGLCLLSDAVMELTPEPACATKTPVRVLLRRRTLYTLSGAARYDWSHAILSGSPLFQGVPVPRARRISVMLRDEVII